jgi:hypothetical protein
MGLLDNAAVAAAADQHGPAFQSELERYGVGVSPFAAEIMALFVAAYYLDQTTDSTEDARPYDDGVDRLITDAVGQMVEADGILERADANRLITSADVFHWVSEYGREGVRGLAWSILPGTRKQDPAR